MCQLSWIRRFSTNARSKGKFQGSLEASTGPRQVTRQTSGARAVLEGGEMGLADTVGCKGQFVFTWWSIIGLPGSGPSACGIVGGFGRDGWRRWSCLYGQVEEDGKAWMGMRVTPLWASGGSGLKGLRDRGLMGKRRMGYEEGAPDGHEERGPKRAEERVSFKGAGILLEREERVSYWGERGESLHWGERRESPGRRHGKRRLQGQETTTGHMAIQRNPPHGHQDLRLTGDQPTPGRAPHDQQLPPQSSNRAWTDDQPYGLSEKSLTNFLREMHQHRRLRNNKNSMLSTTFKGASWTDCSHTVTRSGIQGTKGTKSRTITNINRDWVFLGQQDRTTLLPLNTIPHSAKKSGSF
ncbi:uncharacterized protein H6S33_010810 [Morchella sextelata]|uniref:uncharacterized protein n=1 Tax=Morchella sextelata TaxID=1174677 RepID=UPI001D0393D7|nr:uncharacterized protein H6S33_010810 [Morchella sextelata]KAH0611545.1 hypothetical protein H6S33_010810 [Morchella sextelata]